jgi:hypothetical protein
VESYIDRVYHRDPRHPSLLNGVVKVVVTGEKQAFHDSGELWRVLASTEHAAAARAQKPAQTGTGSKHRQAGARSITTTRRKAT